jgi:excisionase family DNA binding protein
MELLTKEVAANRLGKSVRWLMLEAQNGKIERHRETDPVTRRTSSMFAAADVERLRAQVEPQALAINENPAFPNYDDARKRLAELLTSGLVTPPAPETPRAWLTLAEASEYSGLSERLLHRLIKEKRLQALDERIRGIGRWRVRRCDVDELRAI